jgi:HAD superfamily hydrolase (TIGR01509 family)
MMGQFGSLRAVLWDMDGVLVDSQHAHFISLREVLARYGFELTEEIFKPTFGMTTEQGIRQYSGQRFTDELLGEICALKHAQYRQVIAREAEYIAGVENWLARFKRAGVIQALASSSSWADIDIILDALNARPYFDAVVSGEDCAGKPDPAVFLRAAAQLGVEPRACLVIEDSIAGIQAAAAAGMKCLAIATTFPLEKLPKTDLVLPGLTDLKAEMLADLFRE